MSAISNAARATSAEARDPILVFAAGAAVAVVVAAEDVFLRGTGVCAGNAEANSRSAHGMVRLEPDKASGFAAIALQGVSVDPWKA